MPISELKQYLITYSGSTLKFIWGPSYGSAYELSILETSILTFLGMMTSVLIVSFLGTEVRKKINDRFFKRKRTINKKSRRFVKIWKKWGLGGVAFFTPLLFSPIGGTALAVSFGAKKKDIIVSMTISGAIWSVLLSSGTHVFGDAIRSFLN